jgi:hypothetical protein
MYVFIICIWSIKSEKYKKSMIDLIIRKRAILYNVNYPPTDCKEVA